MPCDARREGGFGWGALLFWNTGTPSFQRERGQRERGETYGKHSSSASMFGLAMTLAWTKGAWAGQLRQRASQR